MKIVDRSHAPLWRIKMNFTQVKDAHNLKSSTKTFIFILWNRIRRVDGEYPREQVMKGAMPITRFKRRVPKIKGYTSIQELAVTRKHYMKDGLQAGWELTMLDGSIYVKDEILNPPFKEKEEAADKPEFTFKEIAGMVRSDIPHVVATILSNNIMIVNGGLTREGFSDFLSAQKVIFDQGFNDHWEGYLTNPNDYTLEMIGGILTIKLKVKLSFEEGLMVLVQKGIITLIMRDFLLKSI